MSESTKTHHAIPLAVETPHQPTPELVLKPHPCGWGEVAAIQFGTDQWELRTLEGPKRGQRCHAFTDTAGFCRWLCRHAKPDVTEILTTSEKVIAALDPADPFGDVVNCELAVQADMQTPGRGDCSASAIR